MKIKKGKAFIKNSSDVFIKKNAPPTEKIITKNIKGIILFRLIVVKVFLNPTTDPKYPGNIAAALVVLARTGDIPTYSNTGSVMKLPPPAREFRPPAKNAAKQTKNKFGSSTSTFRDPQQQLGVYPRKLKKTSVPFCILLSYMHL